jgi:hypothetical protein
MLARVFGFLLLSLSRRKGAWWMSRWSVARRIYFFSRIWHKMNGARIKMLSPTPLYFGRKRRRRVAGVGAI